MSEVSLGAGDARMNITIAPTGVNGRDGRDGKDGADGKDGTGISAVAVENNHLLLTMTDGTTNDAGRIEGVDETVLETVAALDSVRAANPGAPCNRGVPQYDEAILTFTDDDGTLRWMNEHVPVYRKHGVSATAAIVACRALQPVGITTSGDPYEAMSFEQIRALAQEGFDFQSHTWSHKRDVFNPAYNSAVTDAQIDEEYRLADETFRRNGIAYNCMVFPWGAHKAQHLALARRYARYGVNCRGMDGMNDRDADPMDFNRLLATENGGNLPALKNAVDEAIANKKWLIILTHAGATQPDADSLDALLTYAKEKGIRIENFTEAARMKAPAYYAGEGDMAFRVSPDGLTQARLTDDSITALIARAYELGAISPMANAMQSLTAAWTGGDLTEGDTLDRAHVNVTATMADGTTQSVSGFTIDPPLTLAAGENRFTVRYGTLTGTLTVTAGEATGFNLLGEHVTQTASMSTRDRVWFGRRMEAGTYALRVVLSEAMGAAGATEAALLLKTAASYGDTNGTQLWTVSMLEAQDALTFTGQITLTEAADGFFLYAKPLKAGVTVRLYVNGAITDSALMEPVEVGSVSASAASIGEGWFPVDLKAGEHFYKLEVGGAASKSSTAIECRVAASEGETTGSRFISYTGAQCNGGATFAEPFTLAADAALIYMRFDPGTGSTFTAKLAVI